jgi:hypothetical protein
MPCEHPRCGAGIQVPSAEPSSGSTHGVAGAWILAHRYLGRSTHDGACPDICVAVTFVRLQHLSRKSHCAPAYYEGATTLAHRLEFQLLSAQNFQLYICALPILFIYYIWVASGGGFFYRKHTQIQRKFLCLILFGVLVDFSFLLIF